MLPPIFATYNAESKTFQLFQPELIFHNVVSIQPWQRPVKSCWKRYTSKERSENLIWLDGQQWYLVKNQEQSIPGIHTIRILKNQYSYWHLQHTLIWADYIPSKDLDIPMNWKYYPHVPVIEFQNKTIYPSYHTEITPVWYKTDAGSIYQVSLQGWNLFHPLIYSETKPLLIRTPILNDSLSDEESGNQMDLPENDPICSFKCVKCILIVCSIFFGIHYLHNLI